ncbi:cytosolic sulfotransferase 3-like [Neltuma alba]|uniref:cytosolic sulfotransferase 3-like n=1 Tax=Neltuma alba TaxID=207710 RepID=UPI0010A40F32|nr:cytosolic sulfotransferase 3-like [Prosopis alba]
MAETSVTSVIKGQPNVESENEICHEEYEQYGQEYKDLFKSLRREKGWAFPNIYLHEDMWYASSNPRRALFKSTSKQKITILLSPLYRNLGTAEFLECPFTSDEETNGVIKNIAELCSLEKMKELEVKQDWKILAAV